MVNYKIFILLIFLAFFVVGCDSSDNIEDKQNDLNPNQEESETQINDNEENIQESNQNTMLFCETTDDKQPVKNTYYVSDSAFYHESNAGEQGISYRIVTAKQSCVKVEHSMAKDWNCMDYTQSQFLEEKQAIEEQMGNELGSMMGIECSNIEYDEEVFEMN